MSITNADVIGVWELESLESFDLKDSSVSYPIGKNVQGLLIYEANGYMSAILTNKDRSLITNSSLAESWSGVFLAESVAYSGKFSTDGVNMFHHIEVSSCPNLVGKTEERKILVAEQDRFVVSTDPSQSTINDSRVIVRWKRRV